MSEKTLRRLCLVYAWVLGLLILALGVGFAWACWDIYRQGGASPFTRESIALYLDDLAPLVYLSLIGIAGGWVLSAVSAWRLGAGEGTVGDSSGPIKAVKSPSAVLKRRVERLNVEAIPSDFHRKMTRERTLRRWQVIVAVVVCAASLMPAVIRCADSARFSVEHLNRDVAAASRVILVGAVLALAAATLAVLLYGASVARELACIKAAVAEVKGAALLPGDKAVARKVPWTEKPIWVWSVRGIVAVAAVVMVVLGVLNGGMADVLGKAIRICTECIGLG